MSEALSLLNSPENASALLRALEASRERASRTGRRQWLALRHPIAPRDLLNDFAELFARCGDVSDAFYWEESKRGRSILGLGRLFEIETIGLDRFVTASDASRELFRDLTLLDLEHRCLESPGQASMGQGPLLLGGFSFNAGEVSPESEWCGLGPGRLVLPEHLIVCRDSEAWSTSIFAITAEQNGEALLTAIRNQLASTDARLARADDCDSIVTRPQSRSLPLEGEPMGPGLEIRVQADRAHAQYRAQVAAAVDAIEAGKFEKVVLARSLVVEANSDFEIPSFLRSLRELFPSCAVIALLEGGDCFVSASPELLVGLEGERVETVAVAGSAPRGRNPEEEERFSCALLESEKERVEHELVKRAIYRVLDPLCSELTGPNEPALLKLEGIQHLATPLLGTLKVVPGETLGVLDLVSLLHPTPAVCGAPTAVAHDWLEQFEALDRGWYAGPIGFVDARGDGEFRVALRSALLQGDRARLFAGAGIVAGSQPEQELAETRLKLRALLAPLTEI